MKNTNKGEFFSKDLMKEIRDQICYADSDPYNGKRIYFENAGGSLTLKRVCEIVEEETAYPDAFKRPSLAAKHLKEMVEKGMEDTKIFLGAKSGQVFSSQTASRVIFHLTHAIVENVPGTNVVTTKLEHPATYDAAKYYAEKTGKEFRVAEVNKNTGAVDPDAILSKIDKKTCLLSFIYASNISGAVNDVETIIKKAREIKPDLYVLLDATQHIPHAPIDVEELQVDALAFTPYKFLGKRGIGIGYVSDRASILPHEKILDSPLANWELGSIEPAAWGCWSAVIDYVCWLGRKYTNSSNKREQIIIAMNKIESHERAILERLINGTDKVLGLKAIQGVNVHFIQKDLKDRDCILPISIDNKKTGEVVREYMENGIIVYDRESGNIMSRRALEACGLDAVVRVSPMHYNTPEEVDRFLEVTLKIAQQ